MSISKKLYLNFGAILVGVVVLFLVILWAVNHEQGTKAAAGQALEMRDTTDHIRAQVMQNRLYLGNYLLSGDSREVEHMNDGVRQFSEYLKTGQKLASSDLQRSALDTVTRNETAWVSDFAQPMLQKRREVDAGNATVADLQIYYLQKDAPSWVKTSTDALNVVDGETQHIIDERRREDDTAGKEIIMVASLATLAALLLGGFIAFRTARSITNPLSGLMKVARQIGESGDLDLKIDLQRDDEIGQLGRTFDAMV